MQLYTATQARIRQQFEQSMEAMLNAKPGIQLFEALCLELQAHGHDLEPKVSAEFGYVIYTINAVPEHAANLINTLLVMGYVKTEEAAPDEDGNAVYTFANNAARFYLAISPLFKPDMRTVIQAAGQCVACEDA
jgi:hypothetical protein